MECYNCDNIIGKGDSRFETSQGKTICEDCRDNSYFTCRDCNELHHNDSEHLYISRYGEVCGDCYDGGSFFYCEDCGDYHHIDNGTTCDCNGNSGLWLCDGCYESEHEGGNCDDRRGEPTDTDEHRNNRVGKIIKSKRRFGVEVELNSTNCNFEKTQSIMPNGFGVVSDGSLNWNGQEIVSPIMSGSAGEKAIMKMCKDLKEDGGYSVDISCGFHIHIDTPEVAEQYTGNDSDKKSNFDFNKTQHLKNVLLFYVAFDDVMLSLVPNSRKTNRRFCQSLKNEFSLNEIERIGKVDSLEKLWYRTNDLSVVKSKKGDRWDNSRYFGTNFHCLLSQKNLEIRYHNGTISAKKMLYWVSLHQKILDSIFSGKIENSVIRFGDRYVNTREKLDYMFRILNIRGNLKDYLNERFEKFNKFNQEELCAE